MRSTRGMFFFPLWVSMLLNAGCSKAEPQKTADIEGQRTGLPVQAAGTEAQESSYTVFLRRILKEAEIPPEPAGHIEAAAAEGPAFLLDLLTVLEGDPYLRVLVDKAHALEAGYEPEDLVELRDGAYQVSRGGLLLRRTARAALEEMAAAARADGISLRVSSAYRSYTYQETVYERNVRESGQETADRESARPGHSQHQLGLVVDFDPIDDSFAVSEAGPWVAAHAPAFGWSLSYPQGYEALTGYRWESWHYRYVGRDLSDFIERYFQGIQQYALRFIYQWEKAGGL